MSDDTASSLGYGDGGLPASVAPTIGLDAVDESGFSQSLLTFAAIMTFLIMIVGICGNFLTVVALLKCPKVRNVAAAFIISLCIADLLFCALVLPFQGLRFVQGGWHYGKILCRVIPFIQYGNIGVSLLCIAMITINRYVMITHHSCYARIYKRHWIAVMIAACWLVSYGMQLPTLLGAWGRFGYDSRLQTCSIMNDAHGHSSKTTLFITAFVIPCLVIIACYAKIFWVVHKSEQRMKRHATKQNSIPNNLRAVASQPNNPDNQTVPPPVAGSRVSTDSSSCSTDVPETVTAAGGKQPPTRVKDQREVRAKRNEWRITKMVLAIFLSFVVCYLPITIVKVADKDVDHPSLHIFSYIMLYLSACINPIIYVIMNKQYRKAYKTVVLCQPARLLLPFGKSNGANSAAEMERHRIEQQPQPHLGVTDVRRRSSGCSGINNGSDARTDIRLPVLAGNQIGSVTGAILPLSRSDKPLEFTAVGYAPNTATAIGNARSQQQQQREREQQQQQQQQQQCDRDREREQQQPAATQEEQSLLHQQRLQQQRSEQQQPEQWRLPTRSWLAGRVGTSSHHHGGGRHHTGGGGAARNGAASADNDGQQGDQSAHLHEHRQSEEKPIL